MGVNAISACQELMLAFFSGRYDDQLVSSSS